MPWRRFTRTGQPTSRRNIHGKKILSVKYYWQEVQKMLGISICTHSPTCGVECQIFTITVFLKRGEYPMSFLDSLQDTKVFNCGRWILHTVNEDRVLTNIIFHNIFIFFKRITHTKFSIMEFVMKNNGTHFTNKKFCNV